MMHHKIAFLLLLSLSLGYEPNAQTTQNKNITQVVSVNLLPVLFTSFNVFYERAVSEKWTIGLGKGTLTDKIE